MTISPEEQVCGVAVENDKDANLKQVQSVSCVRVIDGDTQSTTSSCSSVSSKHSVSFHQVQVHEFTQWLGDNPSCSEGPPIALSWDCVHSKVLKIDEYETTRGHRRREQELLTCVRQRTNVIKWCCGHSDVDIREQEAQIFKVRKRRQQSVRAYRREKALQNIVSEVKKTSTKLFRLFMS
jgi:hypothetical protein